MLDIIDLVVNSHGEHSNHVGSSEATETAESFLTQIEPWRVADSKEDWLMTISKEHKKSEAEDTYVIISLTTILWQESCG